MVIDSQEINKLVKKYKDKLKEERHSVQTGWELRIDAVSDYAPDPIDVDLRISYFDKNKNCPCYLDIPLRPVNCKEP